MEHTFESLQQQVERLEATLTLYSAHVENLIERVYVLEPHDEPVSFMTPEGVDTRSVLVRVLKEHNGPFRSTDGGPHLVCNCTWEGDNHAEHVADIYEAALLLTRELAVLERNGRWRTDQQEERFQKLLRDLNAGK